MSQLMKRSEPQEVFLPAASVRDEMVEASVSRATTKPYILVGLVALLTLFGGFGIWSVTAKLDGAVLASAEFAVKSKRKTLQHLEGGIIEEILVSEGDRVTAGQAVLRLNSIVDQANLSVIQSELAKLEAIKVRLEAELQDKADLKFPALTKQDRENPEVKKARKGQSDLFVARQLSRENSKNIRNKRIKKLKQEIAGIKRQKKSNKKQVSFIVKELRGLRKLARKGLVPRPRLLALEREAERIRGQSEALEVTAVRAANSIDEIDLEGLQAKKEFNEQVSTELQELEPRVFQLSERRVAAQQKLSLVEVRAPTDGFVVGMKATTLGGVVRAGEDIMDIVPENEELILEARVSTVDIDKIRSGQAARVQLAAFDQATTPEAKAQVLSVSADRLKDERSGESYFLARLTLGAGQPEAVSDLKFVPGMPATVFIQTGSRTPLSYLLQPLSDRLGRVFVDG